MKKSREYNSQNCGLPPHKSQRGVGEVWVAHLVVIQPCNSLNWNHLTQLASLPLGGYNLFCFNLHMYIVVVDVIIIKERWINVSIYATAQLILPSSNINSNSSNYYNLLGWGKGRWAVAEILTLICQGIEG